MTAESFVVQKPSDGTSYRILDPLGFPVSKTNEFLEHLEVRGRSPYTLHSYAVGLADFLGWLRQADIGVDDVTRHVAGQYINDFGNGPKGGFAGTARAGSKRQPRTVNHRLSVLASYFAFLIRQDDEAGAGPWFQRPNPVSTEITGRRHGMAGRDAPTRGRTSEFRRRVPRRIREVTALYLATYETRISDVYVTRRHKVIALAHFWRFLAQRYPEVRGSAEVSPAQARSFIPCAIERAREVRRGRAADDATRITAHSRLVDVRTFFSDICTWATEPDSPFVPSRLGPFR